MEQSRVGERKNFLLFSVFCPFFYYIFVVLAFVFNLVLFVFSLFFVCCVFWWRGRSSGAAMATDSLAKLSRKHGFKSGRLFSVQRGGGSTGGGGNSRIGHSSVISAARMNKAVVLFPEKVDKLVETGVTVNGCLSRC